MEKNYKKKGHSGKVTDKDRTNKNTMPAANNNIKTTDVVDTYLDLINDDTEIKHYNYGGGTEEINPLPFKSFSKKKVG